jgi:hypothetical protein
MRFILNRKSEFIINDTILYPLGGGGGGGGYDENLK